MNHRQLPRLNEEFFNSKLNLVNLILELASFVGSDTRSNYWSCHSTRTTKCCFGRHKHIWHVLHRKMKQFLYISVFILLLFGFYACYTLTYLVFSEKREMKQNFNWLSVGSHYDNFADSSVQCFGSCIQHIFSCYLLFRLS